MIGLGDDGRTARGIAGKWSFGRASPLAFSHALFPVVAVAGMPPAAAAAVAVLLFPLGCAVLLLCNFAANDLDIVG